LVERDNRKMKRSKKMKWVKFTCSVVTPMFMAGADGRTPELRPSEFKGIMRFWWRAIREDDDIEKLKEEEAKIFGGTEKEGKSKVAIRITLMMKNLLKMSLHLYGQQSILEGLEREQGEVVEI
jgi:CRISPR type III-B/RAMP module RAMP protein Cmr1